MDTLAQIIAEVARAVKSKTVPSCIVCGKPLTDAASGPHGIVMACSGRQDDGTMTPGRHPADDHYERSRITFLNSEEAKTRALWESLWQTQKRLEAFQQNWMDELKTLQQQAKKSPPRSVRNRLVGAKISTLTQVLGISTREEKG
jgi:hypothetical protein